MHPVISAFYRVAYLRAYLSANYNSINRDKWYQEMREVKLLLCDLGFPGV